MRIPSGLPPEADEVLRRLASRHEALLGSDMVGLYLFGSLVARTFVYGVSDVDLVAVLAAAPTERQLDGLAGLHARFVSETPEWDERIEVVYVSREALAGFRGEPQPAARISPGEPFHAIEVDRGWILDWYPVRERGVAIFGPPPEALVPEIPLDEYIEAAREHLLRWPMTIEAMPSRGSQAYAVLTACRALRTVETGEPSSKREAASWVGERVPELRPTIDDALLWHDRSRREGDPDGRPTFDVTIAFLREMQRRVSRR